MKKKVINKPVKKCLRRAYNHLAYTVDALADLRLLLHEQQDKREKASQKVLDLAIRLQDQLNPWAEHDDIRIA